MLKKNVELPVCCRESFLLIIVACRGHHVDTLVCILAFIKDICQYASCTLLPWRVCACSRVWLSLWSACRQKVCWFRSLIVDRKMFDLLTCISLFFEVKHVLAREER